MKWKQQLLGMKAYQPGKSAEDVKKIWDLKTVVKLASNENPYGCSTRVNEAMDQYPLSAAIYPDGYAYSLKKALSEHLHVNMDQLMIGNGSDEIIRIVSRALLHSNASTIMPTPSFPQYRHNALIEGAEIIEIPLLNGMHDLEKMLHSIKENTSVIWLCSPNNPTGTLISSLDLRHFLMQVPKDVLVVLDEAYFDYIHDDAYENSIELLKTFSNLLVLRTFSKAYGLASFRVGYGIAHKELIEKLDPVREPFNSPTISQYVAQHALQDQHFIQVTRNETKKGIQLFEAFAEKNNLHIYPSEANFVLLQVPKKADEVFQDLMAKGFIIRSGDVLGTPGYIRITIGTHDQNASFLDALTGILFADEDRL
ncbi:histidinol-phosphate transaminase [Paenisporosarcina cavernae]|uniref:Histidinol-phosphate aminotransferase n=1 Tax=Paenisporosarcina cavernae TaxID=2320858 RepID=A0A385YV76_9BACL|nr:histidinol-phosphate transaminase [Paenisporosarcina cavernae]AYC29393.1 histidinol-phosphate transaminase [Paenisporosarcina cavernae]